MGGRNTDTDTFLSLSVSQSNVSLVHDCPAVLSGTVFERGEKKITKLSLKGSSNPQQILL